MHLIDLQQGFYMFTEIEKVKEEAKEARKLAKRASAIASEEKKKVN